MDYVPEAATAIQVCYNLDNVSGTFDREVNALLKISNIVECKKLLVITSDVEKTLKINDKKIEVIPVWEWLVARG